MSSLPEAPLRVSNAAELFAALRSPRPAVRLAVLRQIQRQPAKALEYGPWEGITLPQELADQWQLQQHQPDMAPMLLQALCRFQHPAVVPVCVELFVHVQDVELLTVAGNYLIKAPRQLWRQSMLTCLQEDPTASRTRLAAALLARDPDLTEVERIRVAVRCDAKVSVPAWSDSQQTVWLSELAGPAWFKTLCLLPQTDWLWDADLAQTVRDHLVDHSTNLDRLIQEAGHPCLSRAQRALQRLAGLRPGPSPQLQAVLQEGARRGLSAAFLAGAVAPSPQTTFDESQDLSLRCALVGQLEISLVAQLLDHPLAQIRSAAVNRLVAEGQVQWALTRLRGAEGPGRAAAAQVLVDLDQIDLLANQLEIPQPGQGDLPSR